VRPPQALAHRAHVHTTYVYIHGWPHMSAQTDTRSTQMNTSSTNSLGLLDGGLLVGDILHISERSIYHRIIEHFGVEATFKGHPVPTPPAVSRDIFNQTRLLRAPSSLTLNVSTDGTSTTSLGNLCQGFTTFSVKNFFLLSSVNLPSLSLKPLFALALSQQALLKSLSPSFL